MMKHLFNISMLMVTAMLLFACSTDKAIRKGDQYYAIYEYVEAAKEYKKAYRKLGAKEKAKRGVVAWKMAEC